MIIASAEFNRIINGKEFNKNYTALAKLLYCDMRDFFQSDFGKQYYENWLKEHGHTTNTFYQYDDEDDDE